MNPLVLARSGSDSVLLDAGPADGSMTGRLADSRMGRVLDLKTLTLYQATPVPMIVKSGYWTPPKFTKEEQEQVDWAIATALERTGVKLP